MVVVVAARNEQGKDVVVAVIGHYEMVVNLVVEPVVMPEGVLEM